MIKQVRETIRKYNLLQPGESVVVAVSGGPDSVALLAALHLLAPEYSLELVVAHLNHGLRKEAMAEELFVKHLAEAYGQPFESESVNIRDLGRQWGKSLEDAARDARYVFLDRVAGKYGAGKIALGHHRQDQAETVLMNLIRGSGLEGLKGMMPKRAEKYIRPLLFVDRGEILRFLRDRKADFVLDESNESPCFLRNRIRHRLLPALRQDFNPRMDRGLSHLAEMVRLEDQFMEQTVDDLLTRWGIGPADERPFFSLQALRGVHEAVQNRVIKRLLESFCPEGKGIAYSHVMAVRKLMLGRQPSAVLTLPFFIRVKREYDKVSICRCDRKSAVTLMPERTTDYAYPVAVPGEVRIVETGATVRLSLLDRVGGIPRDLRQEPSVAFMDYDKILHPLEIRNIRPGDRIQPLGMTGSKKVKALFIDEKIPRWERSRIPFLLDGRSILWIGGGRLCDSARVTDWTTRVLKAEII